MHRRDRHLFQADARAIMRRCPLTGAPPAKSDGGVHSRLWDYHDGNAADISAAAGRRYDCPCPGARENSATAGGMMRWRIVFAPAVAVILAICSASSGAFMTATPQRGPTDLPDWDQANEAVRRLPPAAFPELPASISTYLQRRGCTVPQHFAAQHPGGVVRGHFTSANQMDWDWAVLCSAHRVSTILVFRNGSTEHIAEVAGRPDSGSLEVVADGVAGYDRDISVAPPGELDAYKERYRRLEPQSWMPKGGFDHDGVEDGSEKGSSIYYWSGKYWYSFPGAD